MDNSQVDKTCRAIVYTWRRWWNGIQQTETTRRRAKLRTNKMHEMINSSAWSSLSHLWFIVINVLVLRFVCLFAHSLELIARRRFCSMYNNNNCQNFNSSTLIWIIVWRNKSSCAHIWHESLINYVQTHTNTTTKCTGTFRARMCFWLFLVFLFHVRAPAFMFMFICTLCNTR